MTKSEIQKRYWQSEKGKETKKRYQHSQKNKIAQKRYQQSKIGKITHSKSTRNFKQKYPEKRIANQEVRKAVRNKTLKPIREMICLYCPQRASHYHHHKGYSEENFLNVIPVCKSCHNKIHAGYIL